MISFIEPARLVPLLKKRPILRDIMLMLTISTRFPIFLLIEPTNDCNLDCYFCTRKESKRAVGYMDFELYKKIINESVKFGKRIMIGLQKDGEPLLHPHILEMIKYAKDSSASYVLHLSTNGLGLDKEMAAGILNSGLDELLISIDAANYKTYNTIKGKDELCRLDTNINYFLQLKKKLKNKKPFVRVKLVETIDNAREVDLFKRKWQKLADWVEVTNLFLWGNIKNVSVGTCTGILRYPCLFPWYWPAVNWNGEISICCYDFNSEGIIGNICEDSIFNIWRGDKLRNIRSMHLCKHYDKIPICAKCKLWNMSPNVGGWLKRRFPLTGAGK